MTNAELRQTANVKGIVAVAHSLTWKWGSHVARAWSRWAGATSMWNVRIGKG